MALLIALVVGFVAFYVFLPPISLQSREFYFFAILLMGVWFLARIPVVSSYVEEKGMQGKKKKLYSFFPLLIAALLVVLLVLFSILSLKIFNASRYSSLLRVEEGSFTQDIPQITYDQIPMLDTESASGWETGKWENWPPPTTKSKSPWFLSLKYPTIISRSITRIVPCG